MASTAKKKNKTNAKKKNQDQWDDLVKFIRFYARDFGLPSGVESNIILKSFESMSVDNAPFPPKQMIFSCPLTHQVVPTQHNQTKPETMYMKLLCMALLSQPCQKYTQLFLTKSYSGLRALCFWGCDFGGDYSLKYLCDALGHFEVCNKLEIIDCNIGVEACEHLSNALKHRKTSHLTILRLDHNPLIGTQGLARLCEGLYFNSLLATLSLNYCGILQDGGIFLGEMLKIRDSGIKVLNLEGNELRHVGLSALSLGLINNKRLTTLNLANIQCGDYSDQVHPYGLKELVAALISCTQLTNLNLDGNLLSNTSLSYLLENMSLIKHVTELAITPFTENEIYAEICKRIQENKPEKKKKKKKKTKKKK